MAHFSFSPMASVAASAIIAAAVLIVLLAQQAGASVDGVIEGHKLADERGCLLCHDPTGRSGHPSAPYISGQKKKYLILQMKRYRQEKLSASDKKKTDKRHHRFMHIQSKTLKDSEIDSVAEFFSSFQCISVRSDEAKLLPGPAQTKKCVFCHGLTGIAPYPAYPNIAGQKKGYIKEQLLAYRASSTHAGKEFRKDKRYHRIMSPVVIKLSDGIIEEIADYYSEQSCE